MRFSVAAIAKNESKTLPRLVASLANYRTKGGEILIVDTGSTDETVKVARALGCEVHEVGDKFLTVINPDLAERINESAGEIVIKGGDRVFNFSAARNYAASLCKTDFVAFADCDEIYTQLDLDKIEQEIDKGADQFEYQFIFSHDHLGNPLTQFVQSKFYNWKKMEWRGVIHEHLATLGGTINKVYLAESTIKLEHYQNVETNRNGYLKGLAYDCYSNPENDRNSHYFAREMMYHGLHEGAIKEFKRHISMDKWVTERAQSMTYIGNCLMAQGKSEEALSWYLKSFDLEPGRREPLMKLAEYYFKKDKPRQVIAYVSAALTIKGINYYSNYQPYYGTYPHELLYWAYWWIGDKKKSKEHFDICLSSQPDNLKYQNDRQFYYDYEYKDQGIPGWMSPQELDWLYKTGKTMETVIEIGSWKGRSTHALLSSGSKVTAVDHFLGSKGEEIAHAEAKDDIIYNEFIKNVGSFPNLKINRKDSLSASGDYADGSFDMVFIDGEHTYEGVKADIQAWKSKAKKILSGHDYTSVWPGVMKAVDELGKVQVWGSIWFINLT